MQISIFNAETDFLRLVHLLESGLEDSITITRNGKPIAVMMPYQEKPISRRIGITKDRFKDPESFDLWDSEISLSSN